MKARVLMGFYDMAEGVDRKPGDVFEATEERIAEINGKLDGYVAAVAEPPKKRTAAKKAPVER